MKKIISCILTFLVCFSLVAGSASVKVVYAKTLAQLQAEQKQLKRKQSEAKTALENAKNSQEKIMAEIESLDNELTIAQNELEIVEEQLSESEKKLEESQEKLETATKAREEQTILFSKRIKFIYEKGSIGYLDVLLESKSINDFLTRMQYVNDIMEYDKNTLNRLEAYEQVIETQTAAIEKEKSSIEVLVEDQRIKNAGLEQKISEKESLYKKYQQDENNYKNVIASTEDASNEVQRLINQAVASQKSSGGSYKAYYTGGKLEWPVPGRYYISSGYGNRARPIGSGYEFHTGYDIPASYGSNVVAAEGGTVITASYVRGYGYTVIINHGNGLTTLYGHNSSLVVSVGQTVKRGQVIAKIGSTGNSTGNHCHFEVRVNGKHVSPKGYLGT